METGKYCAYNVTRNVLLSDQVTVAESALGSLQILGLVMHGPGAHQESAVWLTGFLRPPDLPRVVSFDILYLDEAKRVIACGSVGQDTGFPELHEKATSALILCDKRIAQTGTGLGDQLQICLQADLPALLKAASHPTITAHDTPADVPAGHPTPAAIRFEVIRPAEYVFDPFAGSLMYMPEFPEPQPFGTELFLPQTQSVAPPNRAGEISEPQELPPEFNAPLEAMEPTSIDEPEFEVPIESDATERLNQHEPPHFYHPEPIRFFDPAAAAAETGDSREIPEDLGLNEAIPTHSGNLLPPELKTAIQHIDELFRQEQSSKQKTARKKKPRARSKAAKESAIDATGDVQELQKTPAAEIVTEPQVLETGAPLQPASAEPPSLAAHLSEPIPAPQSSLASAAPIEPPAASPRVEIEAELPAAPSSPELPLPFAAPEEHAEPAPQPEPAEPLSALAETTPEIELIEASLGAAAESVPEIPFASAPPVSATTEPIAAFSAISPVQEPPPNPIPLPVPAKPKKTKTEKKSRASRKPTEPKLSLGARLQRWFDPDGPNSGKRRGERFQLPGLVAFYFSGGAPRPHEVVNISKSGFYLRTREFWIPNTLLRMTLQRSSSERDRRSISVLARVVRIDDDGVGHEFVTNEDLMALRSREILPESGTNRAQLKSFLDLD